MSGSTSYDFNQMVNELGRVDRSGGRRSFKATEFGDYSSKPVEETRKEFLHVVDAADTAQRGGKDPLEATFSALADQKKLAIRKTKDGAENALIAEHRLRRLLDEKGATPRYQAMLVDSVAKAHRIDKRIEQQDRMAGIVTGDPREVVFYGGSTTLSAGQRIAWSGASAPVEGGASGKILNFIDNPNNRGEPNLQAKVSLDVPSGRIPRIETISLMTPADLRAGLGPSKGRGPKATMSIVKESLPFTYNEQKSGSWFTPSSQSLDTDGVRNMRPASLMVLIDNDAISRDLVFKAMEISKDLSIVATAVRGQTPAELAAGITDAQVKGDPGIKREGEMDVDSQAQRYDFNKIRTSVSDNRAYIVQEGRGPVATKDRVSIAPLPSSQARAENVRAVNAAGKTIEAQLQSIDDRGMLDIKRTIDATDNAAINTYRQLRDADEESGMQRSAFMTVDGTAKAQRYGRAIEAMDREAGIVSGDPYKVITYGGSIEVSVGQRLVATGSFNQDAEASGFGLRQGSSGKVVALNETGNGKGEPSLYATVRLDPEHSESAASTPGLKAGQALREVTIPLMTPADLKAGLGPRTGQGPKAMMSVVREDIPYTYEEQNSHNHFTASSQSLATKGVQDTKYARGILVASPQLTSDVVLRSIGKAEEGVIVHSPARVGRDAAHLSATVMEADRQQALKHENDLEPQTAIKTEHSDNKGNLRLIKGGLASREEAGDQKDRTSEQISQSSPDFDHRERAETRHAGR